MRFAEELFGNLLGIRPVGRLTYDFPLEIRDGICCDDQTVGMIFGDIFRLGQSQSFGIFTGLDVLSGKGGFIDYTNSGNVMGDYNRVVAYLSLIVY